MVVVFIDISGIISCNGEDSKSGTGGASGGSVRLQTGALYGKGKLQVNGGKGSVARFYMKKTLYFVSFLSAM